MTFSDRVKHAAFRAALDSEPNLGVLVYPKAGAILPDHLMQEETVLLCIGYVLPKPIPDLEVHEEGIAATLSFGVTPFLVILPWRSVLAFGPSTGAEVAQFISQLEPSPLLAKLQKNAEAEQPAPGGLRARLRAVPARNAPKPARPALRLVKASDDGVA